MKWLLPSWRIKISFILCRRTHCCRWNFRLFYDKRKIEFIFHQMFVACKTKKRQKQKKLHKINVPRQWLTMSSFWFFNIKIFSPLTMFEHQKQNRQRTFYALCGALNSNNYKFQLQVNVISLSFCQQKKTKMKMKWRMFSIEKLIFMNQKATLNWVDDKTARE